MRSQRTITLVDDYGDTHEYSLIQHPAGAGFDLLARLVEIMGEPVIIALIGDGSSDVDLGELKAAASAMGEEVELSLRGDIIGPQVTTLMRRLLGAGGHKLVLELLRHTTRDNQQLGQQVAFDAAFQGNYGELFKALKWVATENFGGSLGVFRHPTAPAAR